MTQQFLNSTDIQSTPQHEGGKGVTHTVETYALDSSTTAKLPPTGLQSASADTKQTAFLTSEESLYIEAERERTLFLRFRELRGELQDLALRVKVLDAELAHLIAPKPSGETEQYHKLLVFVLGGLQHFAEVLQGEALALCSRFPEPLDSAGRVVEREVSDLNHPVVEGLDDTNLVVNRLWGDLVL